MFFRYSHAGLRTPVDLDGLFQGETLFLLGGSPKLKELPLERLREPGIVTLGMNNVPCVFKPNLWVSADKPHCFSPHIYAAPEIMKFQIISRRDVVIPGLGKPVRQCPNMYFFGATERFSYANFLQPHRDLVWWRSVFPLALQLTWRLGFRRVFLTGCGFTMKDEPGEQYAWDTELTKDQAGYSRKTYSMDVQRLKNLQPYFQRTGFEVISSTAGSLANGTLPYVPFEQAIEQALEAKPARADTKQLLHSSTLKDDQAVREYEASRKELVGARG